MKKIFLLISTVLLTLNSFGQSLINENSEIIRKYLMIKKINYENYFDTSQKTAFIVVRKETQTTIFNFKNDNCSDISIIDYNTNINTVKSKFDKMYPRIHNVWCLPNSHIRVNSKDNIVFINEISDNGTIIDNF